MDLRKLRHVVTLAQTGNYARAAQALNLTQSALTRSVQALEADLGLRLFDRGRAGVSVTPAGRVLAREGEQLLGSAQALERTVRQLATGAFGQIRFGLGPLPAALVMSDVLAFAAVERPGLEINVLVLSAARMARELDRDGIEFFICSKAALGKAELSTQALAEIPFSLLVRKGHPLTRMESVGAEDLALYPSAGGAGQDEAPSVGSDAPPWQAYAPSLSCDDYRSLAEVALRTDVVLFASRLLIRDDATSGLVELVWRGDALPMLELVLVTRPGHSLSPAAALVVGDVKRMLAARSRTPSAAPAA